MASRNFSFQHFIVWNQEENKVVIKDLGKKVNCQNCEAKFYDFDKKKPVCPKCGTEYVPAKTRTRRSATKSEKLAVVVDKDKIETNRESTSNEATNSAEFAMSGESLADIPDVEEVEDEDEDDALIEGTSDMGDDDDDMAGVVINTDTSDENV
jgi:uncharacterized protein (TIGR02300 family)